MNYRFTVGDTVVVPNDVGPDEHHEFTVTAGHTGKIVYVDIMEDGWPWLVQFPEGRRWMKDSEIEKGSAS